ncbi:unnamed protein product [Linum tenue]|uniref:Uncharacterized protein n=1 Tax=Linum tenue TaxID=586396 RepID=A0AAV0Q5P2_9ROSI|nr:unnamed protein product [Linum tenue]
MEEAFRQELLEQLRRKGHTSPNHLFFTLEVRAANKGTKKAAGSTRRMQKRSWTQSLQMSEKGERLVLAATLLQCAATSGLPEHLNGLKT